MLGMLATNCALSCAAVDAAGVLPPSWSNLTQLTDLRIIAAPAVTGPFHSEWAFLRLQRLELDKLGLSGPLDVIGNISTLTNLALRALPSATLPANLTTLVPNPSATSIAVAAVSGWAGQALDPNLPVTYPNLSTLALAGLGLLGSVPSSWEAFRPKQLSSLQLSTNSLTGTLPGWLGACMARGYTLILGSNNFTGGQLATSTDFAAFASKCDLVSRKLAVTSLRKHFCIVLLQAR